MNSRVAVAGVGCVIGLALVLLGTGADPAQAVMGRAAVVIIAALALWSTGALPEAVTALAFFLAVVMLGIARPAVAFSGFHATAFWLVVGGTILGLAVRRTGLGERLARALVGRIGHSYLALSLGIAAVAMVLAFLMPSSTGRVVLLIPVVLSLADHLGYQAGSRGRIGLVLLVGMMCFNPPTAILPAVVPNMVMMGAAESLYGLHFQYLPWLLAHLPITGLLKAALIVAVCWALFHQPPQRDDDEVPPARPWSGDEKRLLVILTLTLLVWASDGWHGISPAWVALAAGVVCLLPGVGADKPLIPLEGLAQGVSFPMLLHIAGLLSLGAVVAESGLGAAIGGWLLAVLPLEPGATAQNFATLTGISAAVGLVTTLPGVPAVMTPLASMLAEASGLTVQQVLMIQSIGYSTVILPFQVPPLIVAMQMGGAPARPAARLTLGVCGLAVLLCWPLTFLWWSLIGVL